MIKGMKLQLDSSELISNFYVLDVVGGWCDHRSSLGEEFG